MAEKLVDRREPGFYIVDNEIIEVFGRKLGVYGVSVYNVLLKFANASGENAFPSYQTIADLLGISRPKAIEGVKLLLEYGLIEKTSRKSAAGDPTTNIYTLLDVKKMVEGGKPRLPPSKQDLLGGGKQDLLGGKPRLPDQYPLINTQTDQDTEIEEIVPDGTPPANPEKNKHVRNGESGNPTPPSGDPPPLKEPTEWQKLLEELCWIAHGHTEISALRDADKGLLMKEAKKIREKNYTIDDLHIWYTDIWKKDWKSKDSRPNPAIVRASIPAIRSRTPLGFDTQGKEASNGEDEDNGGWDADELAAIKAARAAGDYALAGQIGREGNKRWKERMSQVQGHRLDGR